MKRFSLAALLLLSLSTTASHAQTMAPPNNGVAGSSFAERFNEGCLKGGGQDRTGLQRQRYCKCLLAAYQQRYSESELLMITQLAAKAGSVGPAVVNAMMGPERRRCGKP